MNRPETAIINNPSFTGQINHSISKGIDYLYHHQYPNGEFCVYLSGDDAMQGWNHPDSSIFPSALIGSCLLFLEDHPRVGEILTKTAAFLKYQMGLAGTWNHYTNQHPFRSLCSQDADDTACVSSLLEKRAVDFPKAHNTSLLLNNRRKDGLFYTWFAFRFQFNPSQTYWRLSLKEFRHPVKSFLFWRKMECDRYDVDAVVNANILYYLGEREATQPIINWLLKTISDHNESNCDKWYRNPFTVYYFFSRNYFAGITKLESIKIPLIERILSKFNSDGSFGESIADTAFATCSLLNLGFHGEELEKAVRSILQTQKETGAWERRRIYYSGPKKTGGFGSEELTTAFCLEALERYRIAFT